jgi:DNA-binding MarR family transcriptional regulator
MFSLDQSLGYTTNRLANRLRAELAAGFEAGGFDVTPDQWMVLGRLSEGDGISQKELGIRIAKDKTNTARIMEIMERKGLVERRSDSEDQRQRLIYMTEFGRNTHQQLIPIAQAVLQRAQRGFSSEEVTQLIATLNRVYDNLK